MTASAAVRSLSDTVFGRAPEPVDRVHVGAPYGGGDQPVVRATHPDKAISQRAAVLAAVSAGDSTIHRLADCRDVRRNLDLLAALGVPVRATGAGSITVTGRDPAVWEASCLTLDAGNSATTSRLLVAVLAGSGMSCTVTGNELLRTRPMSEVAEPLRRLGADLTYHGASGRLPIEVRGRPLRGGDVEVAVDSAQPVSALLFAALSASGPVSIHRRTPARDHTERLLRWTGIRVAESETTVTAHPGRPSAFSLTVPGDPSGAALLAALHLASPRAGATLTIPDVGANPRRTGFFDVLRTMGVVVELTSTGDAGPEPVCTVTLHRPDLLTGAELSDRGAVQSMIDEIPLLAALATAATGPTRIRNAAELRGKDTDRIAETVALLRAFGARATPTDDGMIVHPGPLDAPTTVDLVADHRLIFAAMVLSVLAGGGVELRGVGAAATSHPGALADLAHWAPVEAR